MINYAARKATVALSVFLSLLFVGCGGSDAQVLNADFQQLGIRSGSGYGFCLSKGDVLQGMLSANQNAATYVGTAATDGDRSKEACLDEYSETCMVSQAFGPKQVAPQQLQEVRALVKRIPPKECDEQENLECDPCRITTLSVDGTSVDSFCCGELNENFSKAFSELDVYLSKLAQ